jgi:hypothetical protein
MGTGSGTRTSDLTTGRGDKREAGRAKRPNWCKQYKGYWLISRRCTTTEPRGTDETYNIRGIEAQQLPWILRTIPGRIPSEWLIRPHFTIWPATRRRVVQWILANAFFFRTQSHRELTLYDLIHFMKRTKRKMYRRGNRRKYVGNYLRNLDTKVYTAQWVGRWPRVGSKDDYSATAGLPDDTSLCCNPLNCVLT